MNGEKSSSGEIGLDRCDQSVRLQLMELRDMRSARDARNDRSISKNTLKLDPMNIVVTLLIKLIF